MTKKKTLSLGSSISQTTHSSGTLGAFVINIDNEVCLLSCNHVLAQNGDLIDLHDSNSKSVYSPGNSKLERYAENIHVANVIDFEKLSKYSKNSSDFAFAKLVDNIEYEPNIIPDGNPFSGQKLIFPDNPPPLDIETIVYKLGAVSGLTQGRFLRENISPLVEIAEYKFSNVIEVKWEDEPFSLSGDSGSIAFVNYQGQLCVIGLVFAGLDSENEPLIKELVDEGVVLVSYICSIRKSLQQKGLQFI